MSVSDLLQFLAAGRKTGTLKFGRGGNSKEIFLENGLIVGSNSNDPREYRAFWSIADLEPLSRSRVL